MAADLSLLKSFIDGQGAGAQTYVVYDADLDSNFSDIETGFNQLNSEFKAFGGQDAALVNDLAKTVALTTGFVGVDSFGPVTFQTGDTQITIPVGTALTGSGRVQTLSSVQFTGSGSSGTRWFALSAGGLITQETSAGQAVLDLYSLTWTGSAFTTSTLARLPSTDVDDIIVEADDFQAARVQEDFGQGSSSAIPAFTYDSISDRIDDIVRLLGADTVSSRATANSGGNAQAALNPMAFGGTEALPGFILSDGTTYDTTTGLYRAAANALGVSVNATELLRFAETTANEPQLRLRNGTALADPPLSFTDRDNGIGYVTGDEWRLIAGALECARLFNDSGNAGLGIIDGAVGNPGLVLESDRDTGIYSTGVANELAFATGGVKALLLDTNQNVNADSQYRLHVTTTAESIVTGGTYLNVSMDTEVTDVGGWGAAPTPTWTVPTGGGGFYWIAGTLTFDESAGANAGTLRDIALEINGSVALTGKDERAPRGSGTVDNTLSVSMGVELAAAQTVRLQARQDSGGTENVDAVLSIVRLW